MLFENWRKIFYAFQEDHEVNEIYHLSKNMMEKAYSILEFSIKTLRNRESIGQNIDIYAIDKEINALEAEVRRKLFVYQTIDRPNKNHRAVLVISLISHDIERLGDYSKNIYQLAMRENGSQLFGKYDSTLKEVENLVLSEFTKLTSYFEEFNNDVHKSIGEGLTHANEKIENTLKELQDSPEQSQLETKVIISLVLYLRFIKRVSSHLRNIASSYFNPVDRIGFNVEEDKEEQ